MNAKTDLMEALKTAMAASMPTRVVTRDFKNFDQRKRTELLSGLFTIIAHGTGDYGGVKGRFGVPGLMPLIIVGQIELDLATPENKDPSAVEDAEFAMLAELEAFCESPQDPLGGLVLRTARQSGQVDHPYGWIACELELLL